MGDAGSRKSMIKHHGGREADKCNAHLRKIRVSDLSTTVVCGLSCS